MIKLCESTSFLRKVSYPIKNKQSTNKFDLKRDLFLDRLLGKLIKNFFRTTHGDYQTFLIVLFSIDQSS